MQWRRKQRVLYVIGSANHALLIKQYKDGEEATRPRAGGGGGGSAGRGHSPYRPHAPQSQPQPPPPSRTISFNDDEYTKITTPRQDVLFKKGYLGRARPAPEVAEDAAAKAQIGEEVIPNERCGLVNVPEEQYVYTNGYVDHGNMYYMNGDGYELCNFTVLVGPAPAPAPVLAAIPCQPLPLQPLEWFNPPTAFVHCLPHMHSSSESQNSGPQSSESPGSPEECEEVIACEEEPTFYPPHPPAYVYPGYMFGPPVFSMNGLTIQGGPPQPPPTEVISVKHHKKKRRRRRHQGTVDDGSEGSSSYEKEAEKPLSQLGPDASKDCELAVVAQVGSTNTSALGMEVEFNTTSVTNNIVTSENIPEPATQASCKDVQASEDIAGISEEHLLDNNKSVKMYSSQNCSCVADSSLDVETSLRTESCYNAVKKADVPLSKSESRGHKKHLSESKAKKVKHTEKKVVSESSDVLTAHENTVSRRSKKGNKGITQNAADSTKKGSISAVEKGDNVPYNSSTVCFEENSIKRIAHDDRSCKSNSKDEHAGHDGQTEPRSVFEEAGADHSLQNGMPDDHGILSPVKQTMPSEHPTSQETLTIVDHDSELNCIPDTINMNKSQLKDTVSICNNQDAFTVSSSDYFSDESSRIQHTQNDSKTTALESNETASKNFLSSTDDTELPHEETNQTGNLSCSTLNTGAISESLKETHTLLAENVSGGLQCPNDRAGHSEHDQSNKDKFESEIQSSQSTEENFEQGHKELQLKPTSTSTESDQIVTSQMTCHDSNDQETKVTPSTSLIQYAENMSAIIVKEALDEVQLRHFKNLKIKEAVEKWLHSQKGKEVICLTSAASSYMCGSDEESESPETDEELAKPILSGPKNVLRNPLLASSLNFLYMDDASIRVAIKFCEGCVSLANLIPHMKLLKFNSNMKCDNNTEKNICSIIKIHGLNTDCGFTLSLQDKEPCRIVKKSPHKNHIHNSIINEFYKSSDKHHESEEYETKGALSEVVNMDNSLSEQIDTSDMIDCEAEFYIWDSELLKKQLNSQVETELKLESSDNVSCMCDPSLFVGKYYSLGLPVERNNYDSQTDTESEEEVMIQSDSSQSWLSETSNSTVNMAEDDVKSEEAIDVIAAMNQNIDIFKFGYANFSKLNSEISSAAHSHQKDINFVTSSGVNITKASNGLHHESAILMRHLKDKGPFPVGGICCMIQ
ncbi:uncharacterized protein LOC124721210 isoform X1 [Schistocerca piceifrons]|uniref:uncharacterized protein LOC124721210 isoform X1 n=1 Tax=Schistocerca piceifrons TaxID=274613 RepID=UPI001F5ED5FB|nr:uncharacterized protein LOC124721210 isoform X1 [Schistocerca piceifrons]